MSTVVTPLPIAADPLGPRVLELDGERRLNLDRKRPLIMGVLNVTPDSFSDGGSWTEPDRAIEHALEMVEQGADIVDLGAESTRPGGGVYGSGAEEVSASQEIDRLMPVLEPLRRATGAAISVDTRKAQVAAVVLAAGADLINDISALHDPELATIAARHGCPVVLMHSRGELDRMQIDIHFDDVVAEVTDELRASIARATEAGIAPERIVIDPGIGFGKTAAQNLELLRHTSTLTRIAPTLIGASRKSFIGQVSKAGLAARLPGSLAAVAWAAQGGAAMVRVHDVPETAQFLDVWTAIQDARAEGGREVAR